MSQPTLPEVSENVRNSRAVAIKASVKRTLVQIRNLAWSRKIGFCKDRYCRIGRTHNRPTPDQLFILAVKICQCFLAVVDLLLLVLSDNVQLRYLSLLRSQLHQEKIKEAMFYVHIKTCIMYVDFSLPASGLQPIYTSCSHSTTFSYGIS